MISGIIQLFVTAAVVLFVAQASPKIHVKGFSSALVVAVMLAIFSFLFSWLFTLLFNMATLGLFWAVGLGFITRALSTAVLIKIVDYIYDGFKTDGFLIVFLLALAIAAANAIVAGIFF